MTPATITDATGYPGLWCPYTGNDLYMDATHRCRQRQSGAYNWEAWIKDVRDNQIYRIVLMPDSNWWLAQNVKYAQTGAAISGCTADECGRAYTWAQVYASYADGSSGSTGNVQGICPPGWLLPVRATFQTLGTSIGNASTICAALRPLNATCTPKNNSYGWASEVSAVNGGKTDDHACWYTNDAGREDGLCLDYTPTGGLACNQTGVANPGESGSTGVVRCFRQL
jgi:uncharacterized protein (TIGR02145 family)